MLDLTLAIAHHLLIFGLVVMLAVERTLLNAPVIDVKRLARLDGGYGGTATLVIVVGVCRVIWGGKGWAFYETNPFFWAKMGVFLLIGLLSIPPTITFLRWSRQAKADAGFRPPAVQVARARNLVGWELILIFPLVALAAAMARYPF